MFTDIEGSTRLVQNHADVFFAVIGRHFEILRHATLSSGGTVVVAHSDAFFASFEKAEDALLAAVAAQRALAEEKWPNDIVLNVRIGLHTGEVVPVADATIGYVGIEVHRAARISEAANGGQILISSVTMAELDKDKVDTNTGFRFLGSHRLKDLLFPENIYEVQVAGLRTDFPPIKSIDNHPTNLPKAANVFVGRQNDLAAISDLLVRDNERMVTLAGPGGAGKTRLAIEAAHSLVPFYGDGVFLVALGGVTRPSLVLSMIAQTLGVPEYQGRTVLEGLTHFLATRHVLLVLDNFEHLLDASPDLRTLQKSCPRLDFLITTREPLRLSEEVIYPVSPLALPESPRAGQQQDAARSDAVQLFADRARTAKRDFLLDERTTPLVAKICRRLDGLPLAIELAASRLRILSLSELSDRLNESLSVLGKAHHDTRYTTLNEAMSWSFRLLSTEEQHCLARMSVFRGGFSLLAVEFLCGAQMPSGLPLVEILMSLCEKNFLMTNTAGGSSRFTMLETIREFATAKFDNPEDSASCKALHADYYLQFAEKISPGLVGSDQRRLVSELQMEMDNVRAALGWSLEKADFDYICRFLQALLWYLIPRAQFTEGLLWVDRALAIASEIEESREYAVLNDIAGWLKLISGDYAGALPHFKAAHELFTALGSSRDVAKTMITLGATTAATMDGDEGPNLVISALKLCREQNDTHSAGIALIALGEGSRAAGDTQTAAQCYEEALVLMRQSDDQYWMGALLLNMCHVSLSSGDIEGAPRYLREAIQLANEYNYTMMINLYVALAGELALKKGNTEDAARLFGAATSMLRDVGVVFEPADQVEFSKAIEAAKSQLGSQRYNDLHAEGLSWEKSRALEFASSMASQDS
ncbi:AAA family ATPase [Mesorhizobium sp.]|uniref:AAA family ATPase n=1 Tax=Mesorhizobium sp. TaxID=1871066 RepID=UPI00257A39C4|nr:AAA family ATPase [Mesorhizobium sp.]